SHDEFTHEDGLRKIVLHPQLEPPDLVLYALLTGQKHDGNRRQARHLFDSSNQFVSVDAGEPRIGEDEIGRGKLQLSQSILTICSSSDTEARLLQAYFKDPHTGRVRVDKEQLLFGHANGKTWFSATSCQGKVSAFVHLVRQVGSATSDFMPKQAGTLAPVILRKLQ